MGSRRTVILGVPGLLGGGESAYVRKVLALSPARYFAGDERSGTTSIDAGSVAANGTYSGGVVLGQQGIGDGGKAPYYLPASSAEMIAPATGINLNEATFSFWHYFPVTGTSMPVATALQVKGNAANLVNIYLHSTGRWYFWREAGDVYGTRLIFNTALGVGWHHFAGTMSLTGNVIRYWVDGVEQTATLGATVCPEMTLGMTSIIVASAGGSSYMLGRIAHVAWFNSVLSDANIVSLSVVD